MRVVDTNLESSNFNGNRVRSTDILTALPRSQCRKNENMRRSIFVKIKKFEACLRTRAHDSVSQENKTSLLSYDWRLCKRSLLCENKCMPQSCLKIFNCIVITCMSIVDVLRLTFLHSHQMHIKYLNAMIAHSAVNVLISNKLKWVIWPQTSLV